MMTWRPTDPAGHRWELWQSPKRGLRRMIGRVLVTSGAITAGYFTGVTRKGQPCRWHEKRCRSLRSAGRYLVLHVEYGKPPASLARGRG